MAGQEKNKNKNTCNNKDANKNKTNSTVAKRKLSDGSEKAESQSKTKTPRNGKSPKSKGDSPDNSPDNSVSECIRKANSVLYDDRLPEENETDSTVVQQGNEPVSGGRSAEGACKTQGSGDSDVLLYLRRIEQKLDGVDVRLKTLDTLEGKMNKFETDLNKLWSLVHDNIKTNEIKVSQITEKMESLEFSLGLAKDEITQLRSEKVKMEDTLSYVQSQSMRNNLVFTNIPEGINERHEETEQKLRSFMVDKMKLAQSIVDGFQFERVHRMGDRSVGSRNRNIVAKFSLFKDRETVRRARLALKGTGHFVNEQFPKSVADKRRALMPMLKDALRRGKKSWISYDTLYIDGVPMRDTDGH